MRPRSTALPPKFASRYRKPKAAARPATPTERFGRRGPRAVGVVNRSFTITFHHALRSCRRRGLNYMAQRSFRASVGGGENVPGCRPLSAPDKAATALDLVHQAADVFRTIEEHAHETEARAQSLLERLRLSETRAEHAERAQRELLISTDHTLQEASRALEQAQSRIQAQEDQLTAVEFRAQAAEAEAREAKQALALVEDAIRRRLLSLTPGADSKLTAVA
jgi:hypothetical protein